MKVLGLFSSSKKDKSKIRPEKSSLELVKGYGIKGDKFARTNPLRSVMIVPKDAYKILEKNDIYLKYGSLGENILVDFNIMNYKINTLFQIGSVRLKITEHCTICNHLAYFDKKVPMLVQNHRGLYCQILNSGTLYNSMDILELGDI